MPVIRYRSIADVEPPRSSESPTENLRVAFDLMELCRRLHPWPVRRGVQRFRSVAAMQVPSPDANRRVAPGPQ